MCCSIIPGSTSSDITIDNKTSSMKNGETTTVTEPSLSKLCKNNFIASTLFLRRCHGDFYKHWYNYCNSYTSDISRS